MCISLIIYFALAQAWTWNDPAFMGATVPKVAAPVYTNLLSTNLTTWTLLGINAFGSTDTGAAGAGSFNGTSRTTDPASGSAAAFVQADSTAGGYHWLSKGVDIVDGSFDLSCYVKTGGVSYVWLDIGVGGSAAWALFNLSSGSVASTANSGVLAITSTNITSVGDSWYKCSFAGTVTGDQSVTAIIAACANEDIYWNGDNTSGLFLYLPFLHQ